MPYLPPPPIGAGKKAMNEWVKNQHSTTITGVICVGLGGICMLVAFLIYGISITS